MNIGDFKLKTEKISSKLTNDVSLEKRHFHKSKTFLSIMNMARKNTIIRVRKRVEKKKKLCTNPAQYFVAVSLRKIRQDLSMEERRKLESDLFRQWKQLPKSVQFVYKKKWKQYLSTGNYEFYDTSGIIMPKSGENASKSDKL